MSGWIKLHRSIQDNDLWVAEPFTWAQAWIDLLINANHKPGSFWVRRIEVKLDRGQLGWSEITMADRWKWSRGKVRRFLGMLETRGMIVQQTNKLTSVITICNYNEYQADEDSENKPTVQQIEQQAGHQADNRQYTNKNDKNDKKISSNEEIITPTEKKPRSTKPKPAALDYSGWPSMPSDQVMQDWLAMRKAIKASVSQTVINTFGAELSLAVQNGFTVDQCLSQCITRNWRGFKFEWIQNARVRPHATQSHGHFSGHTGQGSGYENPTARIMRVAREAEQQLTGEQGRIIEAELKRG